MKKFFMLSLVMTTILILSATAYADIAHLSHVVLGNLIKISGGNEYAQLSKIDYKGDPIPDKGFDVKEKWRKVYEGDGTIELMTPEEKAIAKRMLAERGEEMPPDINVRDILPYEDFSEATWADMKYQSLLKGSTGSTMVLAFRFFGKEAGEPVAKNAIPTEEDGLLNPQDPIEIVTFDNRITLSFADPLMVEQCEVKLIDSRGNVLGSLTGDDYAKNQTPATINLPNGVADYYLEFYDFYAPLSINGPRYSYALLRITQDPTPAKADERLINKRTSAVSEGGIMDEMALGEKIAGEYMKEKGITDRNKLSDEDTQVIANRILEAQIAAAPREQQEAMRSQLQVINDYMKEKGIKNMAQLSQKDMKEIERRSKRAAILSWPAEYQAVANKYMKQHKIKNYEDLTEKDLNAISKMIQRRESEAKKAAKRVNQKKSTRKK